MQTRTISAILALAFVAGLATGARAAEPNCRVNVNEASVPQLVALPGVGPVIAERIYAGAKAKAFADLADLQARTKGIGEKRAAKMASMVAFKGASTCAVPGAEESDAWSDAWIARRFGSEER